MHAFVRVVSYCINKDWGILCYFTSKSLRVKIKKRTVSVQNIRDKGKRVTQFLLLKILINYGLFQSLAGNFLVTSVQIPECQVPAKMTL